MKFTLKCEYDEQHVITHEFETVFFSDLLDRTQDFLKGCGFVFNGTLDIVEEHEPFYAPDVGEKPTKEELNDIDEDGRC